MAEDKLSQHPRQWAEPWWRALSCGASRRVLILLEIQRILLRESAQTCTLAHMQISKKYASLFYLAANALRFPIYSSCSLYSRTLSH